MAMGKNGGWMKSPLALSSRCTYMMLVLGAPLLMLLDAIWRKLIDINFVKNQQS